MQKNEHIYAQKSKMRTNDYFVKVPLPVQKVKKDIFIQDNQNFHRQRSEAPSTMLHLERYGSIIFSHLTLFLCANMLPFYIFIYSFWVCLLKFGPFYNSLSTYVLCFCNIHIQVIYNLVFPQNLCFLCSYCKKRYKVSKTTTSIQKSQYAQQDVFYMNKDFIFFFYYIVMYSMKHDSVKFS